MCNLKRTNCKVSLGVAVRSAAYVDTKSAGMPQPMVCRKGITLDSVRNVTTSNVCRYRPSQNIQKYVATRKYWTNTWRSLQANCKFCVNRFLRKIPKISTTGPSTVRSNGRQGCSYNFYRGWQALILPPPFPPLNTSILPITFSPTAQISLRKILKYSIGRNTREVIYHYEGTTT